MRRCLSFTRNFVPMIEDSLSNFVQTFVVSVICMLFNSNLVQTGWSPMKSQSGFWPAGELLPIMRGCDGATDTRRRAWDAGSMLQMWCYTLSKPQNGNYLEKNALHGANTGHSSNCLALRVHGLILQWVNVCDFYKWGLCTNRLLLWTTQTCRSELWESENHPEI